MSSRSWGWTRLNLLLRRASPSDGARLAGSEYEIAARRLFERASYQCPADTMLRLRRGPQVLIKMPANGLERVRE